MDHLTAPQLLTPAARRRLPLRRQLAAVIAAAGTSRSAVATGLGISDSIASRAVLHGESRPALAALAVWAGLDPVGLEAEVRGGVEAEVRGGG